MFFGHFKPLKPFSLQYDHAKIHEILMSLSETMQHIVM